MRNIAPCRWFDNQAEEAANFYVSVFKNSRVTAISHYGDGMPLPKGTVLEVSFELNGEDFLALNGGPIFKANEAISFMVLTDDQAETDRYWNAIVRSGGEESACGWCRDKWGFSWQITPRALLEAVNSPDKAAAKRAMDEMMKMKKIDIAAIKRAAAGEKSAA